MRQSQSSVLPKTATMWLAGVIGVMALAASGAMMASAAPLHHHQRVHAQVSASPGRP